jgi:hypothetical protein
MLGVVPDSLETGDDSDEIRRSLPVVHVVECVDPDHEIVENREEDSKGGGQGRVIGPGDGP